MYKIQTLNKISSKGLDLFDQGRYEVKDEVENADAIVLRSYKMHDMVFPSSLKSIARAGAGVNNIPIDRCTQEGIVVFNTPGANANSVKELVFAGLLLSSRGILEGINWVRANAGKGSELPGLVEKNKSAFGGSEIKGKTLGVVGLGAIGRLVANEAIALGMDVVGFDPFISVEGAWGLSRAVQRATSLNDLCKQVDYLTIHVGLSDQTRNMIGAEQLSIMKEGVRILNMSRDAIVDESALLEKLDSGKVSAYVTDFPNEKVAGNPKVIAIPHLGASSAEAEENCAIMAANQSIDFIENGNIKNSVNFPTCCLERSGDIRILIANFNKAGVISKITGLLADEQINIANMINKNRNEIAYNIIDVNGEIKNEVVDKLKEIERVFMVRTI